MKEVFKVESRNVSLFTTIKGNESSKYLIVMLHGGPGSGADAIMNSKGISQLEEDYLLLYFDQRGSGESKYDLTKGLNKEDLTYDVQRIIEFSKEKFPDKEVILWGGSFGGFLGFLYLRDYPKEVGKYIACCPAIYFNDENFSNYFVNTLSHYKDRIPKEFNNLIESNKLSPLFMKEVFRDDRVRSFIFSDMCNSKSLRHICAMSSWFFKERFGEVFLNARAHIKIMQGDKDDWCNYNNMLSGYNTYKNESISFATFNNCGHELWEDDGEKFLEEINNFILEVR